MAKSKKVSQTTLKKLNKLVPKTKEVVLDVLGGETITMEVKTQLSLEEFVLLVKDLSTVQYIDNEFMASNAEVMFAFKMCEYFTNLDLPEDPYLAYEIIISLNLLDKIYKAVNETQLTSILVAMEASQKYDRAGREGINGLLKVLMHKVNEFDAEKILAELQKFTPEQLANFENLKVMADIFRNPGSVVNAKVQ